jgi:hypothetical protein
MRWPLGCDPTIFSEVTADRVDELGSRVGAALGALMAINLWLGLYNAPGEWP